MNDVMILTSSYRDSGLTGLKPVGLIAVGVLAEFGAIGHAVDEATGVLEAKARSLGCTHVLNVTLRTFTHTSEEGPHTICQAQGDGYSH